METTERTDHKVMTCFVNQFDYNHQQAGSPAVDAVLVCLEAIVGTNSYSVFGVSVDVLKSQKRMFSHAVCDCILWLLECQFGNCAVADGQGERTK